MKRKEICLWTLVKIYKKDLVFFVEKNSKCVLTIDNVSLYCNASQYSGAIKYCKKFTSPINR